MKKTRFTETQIVKAIQEHENGRDAKDMARHKFKEKDYKKCLEIYTMIEHKNRLSDFDKKALNTVKKHS